MVPRPSRRTMLLIDVALVGWAIAWIVIGVQIGRQMREVSTLGDTVVLAGGAIEQTGGLLSQLRGVPFFGGEVADLADRISETGRSAQVNALDSRESIQDLSVLLAVAVALIPTIPLVGVYLPLRIRWGRERNAVGRALAAGMPGLDELLADRARHSLPLERVLALGDDTKTLADAELARLGLRRR